MFHNNGLDIFEAVKRCQSLCFNIYKITYASVCLFEMNPNKQQGLYKSLMLMYLLGFSFTSFSSASRLFTVSLRLL